MVWYGLLWYGMVWYGMVWYGMVWNGMVYGMVRYGMEWNGSTWHGMAWHGMVWYDLAWYGMVWYIHTNHNGACHNQRGGEEEDNDGTASTQLPEDKDSKESGDACSWGWEEGGKRVRTG